MVHVLAYISGKVVFFLLYIVLHVLSDEVSAEVTSLRVSDESVHLVTKISSNKNSKHPLLL